MKIIKRNGQEADFDPAKILRVINLANNSVSGTNKIQSEESLQRVYDFVLNSLSEFGTVSVETIQDKIRDAFMNFNYFEVADSFIKYRQEKTNKKKFTDSEEKIISTCNHSNESVKQDNANKNPQLLSVQRDYIAGISCKDIAKKTLPKDIIEAHDKGLIHYHDMDYSPLQKMSNCCLVNFKDMRENGFSMNSVTIHQTTKGFLTDCTLASQASAQVAGQQYGGQTMSWSHIAKSISITRNRILKELIEDGLVKNIDNVDVTDLKLNLTTKGIQDLWGKEISDLVEKRVQREISTGVKTVQYQILTILCSNGQTPFISMSMNLEDCEGDEQWEADTKRVFEEVLKQRIKGIPDEKGNYIPVVFPKLLYFLDERNHKPGTENWWLTKLAAKSAAKTMAPDFISAKVQKKIKHTNYTWPNMGCLDKDSVVKVMHGGENLTIPFGQLYELVKTNTEELDQFEEGNPNKYLDLSNGDLSVFDSKVGNFVRVEKLIRNIADSSGWKEVILNDGHSLRCTDNHPHTTTEKDSVFTKDLKDGDELYVSKNNGIIPCKILAITNIRSHEDINSSVEFELLD